MTLIISEVMCPDHDSESMDLLLASCFSGVICATLAHSAILGTDPLRIRTIGTRRTGLGMRDAMDKEGLPTRCLKESVMRRSRKLKLGTYMRNGMGPH